MKLTAGTLVLTLALAPAAGALDLDALKTRGSIRVIVAADEAPETFSLHPAEEAGFERELLEGFARLGGLKLEVVTAPGYAERIPLLLKGGGDVIAAIFDTPERRRQVDFTVEVMPTHDVAVTLKPRKPVASLAELKALKGGVAVGVIKGAKPAETAVEAGVPPAALVGFERREELLEVAWAVRKEDHALRKALDEYLGNVRRGPSWSRLIVKYFGDQALSVLGRNR